MEKHFIIYITGINDQQKGDKITTLINNRKFQIYSIELGQFQFHYNNFKVCSQGAIEAENFLMATNGFLRHQCKCSHGAFATVTLNPMQPISCDK